MPRNGKEGILFSFVMSALMIYIMAALNMYVRAALGLGGLALETPWQPWWYAVVNFPLAFVVGMICDLGFCTPTSRKVMQRFCHAEDRAVWKGITVKFMMVVLMTVAMTVYGAIAATGWRLAAVGAFFTLLPYNFIIALPIQMLAIAPLAGKIVHAVGDRRGWNEMPRPVMPEGIRTVADIMEPDVFSVPSTATVGEALQAIIDRGVSGMPVVGEGQSVVGFVSDSDVLRTLSRSDAPVSDYSTLVTGLAKGELPREDYAALMQKNVLEVATPSVLSVAPTTSVDELSSLFGYRRLKKVPVMDGGKLVGVVNRSTLSRRAMESYLAK